MIEPVREGEVLAGKYRVERVLGAGGMGVVVAAHHLQLDERVALKFLLPGAGHHAEVVARFAREARAAAKIKSEHVARVTDVGVLENGAPYLVMEFLAGMDLGALLQERGALPPVEVVDYVLQACEAIAEAHSLGIVHRDLKPGNLFFARRHDGSPCIKVLDFGISKFMAASSSDIAMTATNATLGSPLYMSPEQMQSAKSVDHRADIWSLGVILYELLTAKAPFVGTTFAELVLEVATRTPPPPREHRAELPPALDAVILRCLEKEPVRRFAHVGELAAALVAFGSPAARTSVERILRIAASPNASPSTPPSPGPTSPSVAPEHSVPNGTGAAWGKTQSRRPAPKRLRALVLSMVAAALAVTGWLTVGRSGHGSGASASALQSLPPPPATPLAAPAPAVEAGAVASAAPKAPALEQPVPVAKLSATVRGRRPHADPAGSVRPSAPGAPVTSKGAEGAPSAKLDFGGRD